MEGALNRIEKFRFFISITSSTSAQIYARATKKKQPIFLIISIKSVFPGIHTERAVREWFYYEINLSFDRCIVCDFVCHSIDARCLF